jgi:hypothetical protein
VSGVATSAHAVVDIHCKGKGAKGYDEVWYHGEGSNFTVKCTNPGYSKCGINTTWGYVEFGLVKAGESAPDVVLPVDFLEQLQTFVEAEIELGKSSGHNYWTPYMVHYTWTATDATDFKIQAWYSPDSKY